MSEHQLIAFRAIDQPVSETNLEFMRRQSSRAEITPLSFDNEYHYGDFRGNAVEMLRRGYDLHLHYANFGIRKLLIRLPDGLPDSGAAEVIRHEAKQKAAAIVARQRAKRLAAMAADPGPTLKETEELAKQRSTTAYRQIATLLAELREALAEGKQSGLAEQQAKS